jgi:hypothetical protein
MLRIGEFSGEGIAFCLYGAEHPARQQVFFKLVGPDLGFAADVGGRGRHVPQGRPLPSPRVPPSHRI